MKLRITTPSAGLALLLAALCGALWIPSVAAEAAALREYEIKAGYLAKFIEYVEWPRAQQSSDGVIELCMLGDDPFGAAITPLRGKSIEGRTLRVKELGLVEEARQCDLLFISASEGARMGEILGQLRSAPVLIVSEIEGAAERGVIINFVEERNRVRFEINAEAARRNGFTISSQLLKLARLVGS